MKKDVDIQSVKIVWERMKHGDRAALAEIFSHFYSDLYHYGLKIFNLPDLVNDSIQDVFIRIWDRRSTLGDISHPKAYLISCLRRKLFENKDNYFGTSLTSENDPEFPQVFYFEAGEFMEASDISLKLRQSLIRTINSLSEHQRELLLLRFYHNLSYSEIAQVMKIKEQSVKNLMQRVLLHLRSQTNRQLMEGVEHVGDLMFAFFHLFSKK